jgi:multiple sugar transport system permease protein
MSELVVDAPQVATSRVARQVKYFPWILFGPTILYLFLLTVFPLLYSLYISLFQVPIEQNAAWTWVGLGNYGAVLSDPAFWQATIITLIIAVIAVSLEVVLGIIVALVLSRRLAGMGFFRLLVYLPMMLSPLVMGLFWKFMLDGTFGVVNWLIEAFLTGIPGATFTFAQILHIAAIICTLVLIKSEVSLLRKPPIMRGDEQKRMLVLIVIIFGLGALSLILPELTIRIFENGLMGTLNPVITALGGQPYSFQPIQWTIEPTLAVASIILVDVWQWTPFVALLATAGLQTVPPQLYEAATLDRASRRMQFRRITLPFLITPLLVAVLFRSIDTIKIFDSVWLLTGGGPGDFTQTWSVMVYKLGFVFNGTRGQASAVAWIMVIVINIIVTVLLQLVARSRSRSRMAPVQE